MNCGIDGVRGLGSALRKIVGLVELMVQWKACNALKQESSQKVTATMLHLPSPCCIRLPSSGKRPPRIKYKYYSRAHATAFGCPLQGHSTNAAVENKLLSNTPTKTLQSVDGVQK